MPSFHLFWLYTLSVLLNPWHWGCKVSKGMGIVEMPNLDFCSRKNLFFDSIVCSYNTHSSHISITVLRPWFFSYPPLCMTAVLGPGVFFPVAL